MLIIPLKNTLDLQFTNCIIKKTVNGKLQKSLIFIIVCSKLPYYICF